MSGGAFDYIQYNLEEVVTKISAEIGKSEHGRMYEPYSDATIEEFKRAITIIQTAAIYMQRIDWLISCDDGEETFHSRLKDELDKELEINDLLQR